jgi:N-acetylmuramoyl-L-alanine amidase
MIGGRTSRALRLFLAPIAITFLTQIASAASDWQVIKVGPRDYLTLENVAKFYGFPAGVQPTGPTHKTLHLDDGRSQLEVTLDSREAIINGVRNWLSFPVIAKDGHFLISRVDLAKTVEPQLRPHMIPNLGKIQAVVLDPGHGAHDKGACSSYGCEKDYTLDVARQLKPLLEAKGLKVVMTRDSDVFIPLDVRARIANTTPNSVFVSIHFNATDFNPAATGFEIYSLTPRGAPSTQDDALALRFFNMQVGSPVDAPSLALSTSIYHSVLGHIPEFDRGIKRARFAVLRLTKVPAVLVEGGFLTEHSEGRLIANSAWRAKLAQSISVGLENYKALVEKHQQPMLLADYQRQLGGQLIARDATQPPPESAIAAPPMMPASISQLAEPPASVTPTQTGTVGPANGEQEQDEPRAANEPPAANAPPAPNAAVAAASPSPEESMPASSPPPAVAENSPRPQSAPSPSPAASPQQKPLQKPTLAERILRSIPVMPHFEP